IVNIMKTTLFSYEVVGGQNALWIEVSPANYKTVYPASGPQPPPASGSQIVKVSFNHTPGTYAPPNQLHWNLFDDGFGKCAPAGPRVLDDHLFASPLIGYVQGRRQQVSRRPRQRRRRTYSGRIQSQYDVRPHARGPGGVVDRAGRRH